jgi:hypothetical protein
MFRSSFPSFVTFPVIFSIIELLPDICFHSRRTKALILAAIVTVGALWFEFLVPLILSRSAGDIRDAVALFLGFATYWLVDCWSARRVA